MSYLVNRSDNPPSHLVSKVQTVIGNRDKTSSVTDSYLNRIPHPKLIVVFLTEKGEKIKIAMTSQTSHS